MQDQETVDIREIRQTEQEQQAPPPPRPPVPVEVPNNEIIEQETPDFDASLDLDESLDTNLPPPSQEEEQTKDEEQYEQEIFVAVEEPPKLIGGMKALRADTKYPEFARKAGIQGRVIVEFVVNTKGNVENPHVTRGVHKLLNEAAIEAIEKQAFVPGKQRGDPVKVRMSLPVTFRLETQGA